MVKRKVYLDDVPLDEAWSRWWGALETAGLLQPLAGEPVPLMEALGRVTVEPVWARQSVPHYHAAAMDGVAIRAEDATGASETTPIRLALGRQATWVDTGDPLPPGSDAVVMIEHVQTIGDDEIELIAPVAPWQHVRAMGEDIVATELVLPSSRMLSPVDLGALAASGHVTVSVRRRPRVAVLPTGSELVEPGSSVQPGQVVDFNSVVLSGQLREWGAEPRRYPITPDAQDLLRERVIDALARHDVVVVNAGSSAGSEDFTARVIEQLGVLHVHGVAIRPGHPLILGMAHGKAVLGLPGYPVSTVLTAELFLRPLVFRLLGILPPGRPHATAVITRKVVSPMGEDEYVRVRLGRVGARAVATPLPRGAGVIMSLVRADGIVTIPRLSEGLHPGDEVDVVLLRPPDEVERTVVAIGSHDLTLDLLSSRLAEARPGASLSSSNVGSLGGLLALQRREAHLAGSHLLDEATGEYNLGFVERLLPGRALVVMTLVHRQQGLLVRPGNPKGITGLDDLARPDVLFVNRQKGAGTRVLLDYELRKRALDPSRVRGYEREEFTHLAVAAAVASGTADVGLGILGAARALALDFVPLLEERYDLVIPREFYESPVLAPVLEVVRGPEFRRDVMRLGGYNVSATGVIVAELG